LDPSESVVVGLAPLRAVKKLDVALEAGAADDTAAGAAVSISSVSPPLPSFTFLISFFAFKRDFWKV
jgi:hypothetical protein